MYSIPFSFIVVINRAQTLRVLELHIVNFLKVPKYLLNWNILTTLLNIEFIL